jgi:hypothetical protein
MRFDHVAQRVPDIASALAWWQRTIPDSRVLYADRTWGLLDAAGVRLAFVKSEQHPNHLTWRASEPELVRLAVEHGVEIADHRDESRSFYLEAPGRQAIEVVAYPGARRRRSP